MAEVWEAHDENLDRAVAVKMLHAHLSQDAEFVSRFRREALSIAKLSHPNVVAIFDTGVEQYSLPTTELSNAGTQSQPAKSHTRAYIVMELIRGDSLRALLGRGVTIARAVDIVRQAADGLAYAHRNGLIHRDVKPANILVQRDGHVKVVDFGIAKLTDRRADDYEHSLAFRSNEQHGEDLTQVGAILGTAKYLAPEQVEGGEVDARSDIYALGIVLYEALCGQPPFSGSNDLATALKHVHETAKAPRQIRPGISRALEAVVTKAMARNSSDRFRSAEDLSGALRLIDLAPDDALPVVTRSTIDATPAKPIRRISSEDAMDRRALRRDAQNQPTSSPSPNDKRNRSPTQTPAERPATTVSRAELSAGERLRTQTPDPAALNESIRGKRGLVALVAIVGLALGSGLGLAVSSALSAMRTGRSLALVEATAYDPFGDDNGQENNELASLAIDSKLSTAWQTTGYRQINFNGAKRGVGLAIRLSKPTRVGHLRVVSSSRGWSAEVYVASAVPSDFLGWGNPVGKLDRVTSASATITLNKNEGSYVLLWITALGKKANDREFARVVVQEVVPQS